MTMMWVVKPQLDFTTMWNIAVIKRPMGRPGTSCRASPTRVAQAMDRLYRHTVAGGTLFHTRPAELPTKPTLPNSRLRTGENGL